MNAEALTALLSAGGACLAAIGGYYASVKSSKSAAANSTIDTWRALSAEYKADRDAARAELDAVDTKYRARIRELETDYQSQLTTIRARCTQLETDLAAVVRTQNGEPSQPP